MKYRGKRRKGSEGAGDAAGQSAHPKMGTGGETEEESGGSVGEVNGRPQSEEKASLHAPSVRICLCLSVCLCVSLCVSVCVFVPL